MKKSTIIISVYALIGIVIFCFLNTVISFNGYYQDADTARLAEELYLGDKQIFSIKLEDEILDFVIKDELLYIVKIDCKESRWNTRYRVRSKETRPIDSIIDSFMQEKSYNWKTLTKFMTKEQIKWCIVSDNFNLQNDQFHAFEFEYKNNTYHLCYDMK